MKNLIERTLFWFIDGGDQLHYLDDSFFALGTLENRLLNEGYSGKKIKFINIDFCSRETYSMFPDMPMNYVHYYGGHLRYYAVLDFYSFNEMNEYEQNRYIWKRVFDFLKEASITINNTSLEVACESAYKKGLEIDLNPDYRMVQAEVFLYGKPYTAAVWLNFDGDNMSSKFTLERDGHVVFEKFIDSTKTGIEFFLVMYKSIVVNNNVIVIKGRSDVKYLPLKIPIEESMIE